MAPLLPPWQRPLLAVSGSRLCETALGRPGELFLVLTLSLLAVLLLLSLLLLCAGCQGRRKAASGHAGADNENLMNGQVSDKDPCSQSLDSAATELPNSSSHNGPPTTGTVLTNTQDTSPQPSEELLSSQSELRSAKCPQDRELPSIPPNSGLMGDRPPALGDSTYEVVREIAAPSRDVSTEDSLYETVKELKDSPAPPAHLTLSPAQPEPPPPVLANGHLSPDTPERGPLCAGVEYASVDWNKKSRYSADLEAKRRSEDASMSRTQCEDVPPPLPEKVLDENDNQPEVMDGSLGSGLDSSEAGVYSTVNNLTAAEDDRDKESDYSCIGEMKGLLPSSSSCELYATVGDIYAQPDGLRGGEVAPDGPDPGYESILMAKALMEEDRGAAVPGAEATRAEPDYESVGELAGVGGIEEVFQL